MATHFCRPRAPAWRPLLAAAAALLLGGCAIHRAASAPDAANPLSAWIERMQVLSSEARPLPPTMQSASALETWDPQLAAALAELQVAPSAAAHIRVASEYRRRGILDQSYSHLSDAIALDRRNAMAYDLRARIWRDWRFPHLGYADAYKALELAPDSPAAMNTLGTLFQSAGNQMAARLWYERALTFDPYADYAIVNVCHLDVLRSDRDAVQACQYAMATTPGSIAARNNLAFIYTVSTGEEPVPLANPTATRFYNDGVTLFAHRQYGGALQAFATALRINPLLPLTPERMRADRRVASNGQ